jgi:hypothetical protein
MAGYLLTPEEELQRLLANPFAATPPGLEKDLATLDPMGDILRDKELYPYDPPAPALATSDADATIDMNMPREARPNQTSGSLLEQQAQMHNNKAMEMLQKTLDSQAELTPQQALAAGMLALVPTLGGYIAGRSIGTPKLSPHLRLSQEQLEQSMTGGPQGAMIGLAAGNRAAQQYVGGFDKRQERDDKIRVAMAEIESRQGEQANTANLQVQAHEANRLFDAQNPLPNNRQAPATPEEKEAKIHELLRFAGKQLTEEDETAIRNSINDAVTQSDLYRNAEYSRRLIGEGKRQSGEIAMKPSQTVMDKLGAGDNVEVAQERLRSLATKALDKLGPGFGQAYLRKGLKLLPANEQQEFMANLEAAGMEMNRAVDPSPNVTGADAMRRSLDAAVDNGNFFEKLDYEAKKAKSMALSHLRPFTVGPTAHEGAKSIYEFYNNKWASSLGGSSAGTQNPEDLKVGGIYNGNKILSVERVE